MRCGEVALKVRIWLLLVEVHLSVPLVEGGRVWLVPLDPV